MSKTISEEVKKEALKLFQEGGRYKTIAKQLDLTTSLVWDWQHAFDQKDYRWISCRKNKFSESQALLAVNLYTKIKSYSAVAHRLGGMSPSDVRRFVLNVSRYGIPFLPRGVHAKAKLESLTKAREQGEQLMSKHKPKTRWRSLNSLKKERDEYKVMLECLLKSIEKNFEHEDQDSKKKGKFLAGQLKRHVEMGYPLPDSATLLVSPEVPFIDKLEALVNESLKIQSSCLESELSKIKTMGAMES